MFVNYYTPYTYLVTVSGSNGIHVTGSYSLVRIKRKRYASSSKVTGKKM